jgi:hypothetical protein
LVAQLMLSDNDVRQVDHLSTLGIPWRCYSPLLSTFPWKNGCILEPGPLMPWITSHLPSNVELGIWEIIQSMAQGLDTFDLIDFHQHPAHFLIWLILSSVCPPTLGHHSFIHTAYLGKVILTYQILDTLLWVWDFPPHANLRYVSPSVPPRGSSKLVTLLEHLRDLPGSLDDLQRPADQLLTPPSERHSMATSRDPSARTLQISLENFTLSQYHWQQRGFHTIFQQVHSMASVLRWFTPSHITFSDKNTLLSFVPSSQELHNPSLVYYQCCPMTLYLSLCLFLSTSVVASSWVIHLVVRADTSAAGMSPFGYIFSID